jgi:hypothetical protein
MFWLPFISGSESTGENAFEIKGTNNTLQIGPQVYRFLKVQMRGTAPGAARD